MWLRAAGVAQWQLYRVQVLQRVPSTVTHACMHGMHGTPPHAMAAGVPPTQKHLPRRLLRLRTRDLRQLRHLAQEVLLQRSDVEALLVSGILQVRAEIAAAAARGSPLQQATQPAAAGDSPSAASLALTGEASNSVASTKGLAAAGSSVLAHTTTTLAAAAGKVAGLPSPPAPLSPAAATAAAAGVVPDVVRSPSRAAATSWTAGGGSPTSAGASQAAASPSSAAGHVDVKDLSWEDRERILRLLFAKINKAAQVRGRLLLGGQGLTGALRVVVLARAA